MIDLVPFRLQVDHQFHIRQVRPVFHIYLASPGQINHSIFSLAYHKHFLGIGRNIVPKKLTKV